MFNLTSYKLCISAQILRLLAAGIMQNAQVNIQEPEVKLFYIHERHEMVNFLPTLQTPSQRDEG